MKVRYLCLWVVVVTFTLIIRPVAGGAEGHKSLVAAGNDRTMVIQKDGSLWVCGDNNNWRLGLGDTIDRITLTRIGTATNWTSVAHYAHALALKANGTLLAWGGGEQPWPIGTGKHHAGA
jgi:hypothetical protein